MIQRRTFLGGLLAAVATAHAYGRTALNPKHLELAEKRILESVPEPEEGYHLLISPGYGLPQMRGMAVTPIPNPDLPAEQELTIHMKRPGFFSNEWSGTIKPSVQEYDAFRRASMQVQVEGDDVMVAYDWIRRMCKSYQTDHLLVAKTDYVGTATFGQKDKDPIIKLDGLFPTNVQTEYTEGKMRASIELSFDWVHQNVWKNGDWIASAEL